MEQLGERPPGHLVLIEGEDGITPLVRSFH
jgi:hypothetical protein